MASLRLAVAIAAGTSNPNLLQGENIEFIGSRPAAVKTYAVQDGVAATELTLEVSFGNLIAARRIAVPLATAGGIGPLVPDHLVNDGVAMPGDRIQIRATSTAAAAPANLRVLVVVDSL